MGDECYSADRINAVCEELAGFILNKILDPRGEFYHDSHTTTKQAFVPGHLSRQPLGPGQ